MPILLLFAIQLPIRWNDAKKEQFYSWTYALLLFLRHSNNANIVLEGSKSAGKLEPNIVKGVSPVDNQVFPPNVKGPDVPKESVAAVVTKSVGKLESNIGKGVSPVDNHVVLSAVVGSDAPDEVILESWDRDWQAWV